MKIKCGICPRGCELAEGQTGFCRARSCRDGRVVSDSYGRLTSMALDPIEKKPLNRFYPGSYILSVGSFGCNLRCSFCQNYHISMCGSDINTVYLSPGELVEKSCGLEGDGNIGIAFTYNEPFIGIEYILDCAKLAKQKGQRIVLVTNGYVNKEPLEELLPFVDAMNIDLKAFNNEFYREIGGDLETVKSTIEASAKSAHVEITTLIIPGKNDSEAEMDSMARWIAGIDKRLPLHVSRFFPQYRMTDRPPTAVKEIYSLAKIARRHLEFVYEGNC